MIYTITQNDPAIYKEVPKFDFENPPIDPVDLSKNLCDTLISNDALGLAANQCGLPYRVFAIKAEQMIVCFNPVIVDSSEETSMLDEGCLSFFGLILKIKRPGVIKVRYTEPNGNVVTTKFQGITARVFQHELDHLDGRTFHRLATPLQLEKARQQQKKLLRKQG